MTATRRTTRRGLTLVELMLALTITALIAGAISGMMSAVTVGVSTRRDTRTAMIGGHVAASRLGAYVAPSRCILDASSTSLTLWFNDRRLSRTVHASEVRWLVYDAATGTISVQFLDLPDHLSVIGRDLADGQFAVNSSWEQIRQSYEGQGRLASVPLIDNLLSLGITTDQAHPRLSTRVAFELGLRQGEGTMPLLVTITLHQHEAPTS